MGFRLGCLQPGALCEHLRPAVVLAALVDHGQALPPLAADLAGLDVAGKGTKSSKERTFLI